MPIQSAYAASSDGGSDVVVEQQDDQQAKDGAEGDAAKATADATDTSAASDAVAASTDDSARAVEGQAAEESAADDTRVQDSQQIVIDDSTECKVTLDLFTDDKHTTPLGDRAVSAGDKIYAALVIDFKGGDVPEKGKQEVLYTFPDNITSITMASQDLYDEQGNLAGEIVIEGNKLCFRYTEDWLQYHPSEIMAKANFSFSLSGDNLSDGDEVPIHFPGTGTTVTVHVKDGNVDGNKWGKFNSEDQTIEWTVDLNVASSAKNLQVKDALGNNLEYVKGSFQVDEQAVSADVNGQSATISVGDLTKGNHKLTYKTKIKQSALDALKNGEGLSNADNKAQWSWGSDNNRQISDEKTVWAPQISYNMVGKSASGTPDDITWTVTVNSGNLKANMAGYVFTDKLGDGQAYTESYEVKDAAGNTVDSGDLPSDGSSFTYQFPDNAGNKQYTITYHTKMTDPSSLTPVTNTAEVKPSDGKGPEGRGTGTFTPKDDNEYVKKEFVSDDGDGNLSWKSTILTSNMSVDTDPSTVSMHDHIDASNYQQITLDQIEVSADGVDLVNGEDYVVSDNNNWNDFTVTLKNTEKTRFLLGENDITVTYRSHSNGASDTYKNTATVKNSSSTATHTVKNAPQVQKDGNVWWDSSFDWSKVDGSSDKGAWVSEWTVRVNAYKQNGNWSPLLDLNRQPVNVTDTLPANMSYVTGSVGVSLNTNDWTSVGSKTQLEPTESNGQLSWSISTDTATEPVYVKLNYKTAAKAEDVSTEGKIQFTNTALADSGETRFPKGSKTVETDNKVLSKTGSQIDGSSQIRYNIKVNETAVDLVPNSDTVELTDTMDAAVTFVPSSLKVYKLENGQRTGELSSSEYRVSAKDVQVDGQTRTRLTLSLPDGTPLEVEYRVLPAAKPGDSATISNDASLSGVQGGSVHHGATWVINQASGSTTGTSYSISVNKLDAEDISRKLAGATFELYSVDLDAAIASGNLEGASTLVSAEQTPESGTAIFGTKGTPLKSDTLYWFRESAAPGGYKLDSSKHFFMLKSDEFDAAKAKVEQLEQKLGTAIELKTGNSYNVYDEKIDVAPTRYQLAAQKVLNGRDFKDGESFAFQLKDSQGNVLQEKEATAQDHKVVFDAIDYTAAGDYTYTIAEKAGGAVNTTYDTTEHQVTVHVTESDGKLVATSNCGVNDPITITNTYTKPAATKVAIEGTKSLTGRDLVDGEFEFKLTPVDGTAGEVQTARNDATGKFDFGLSFDGPGTYRYTVSEVAGNEAGVTYDGTCFGVTVKVTEVKGAYKAEVSYDNGKIAFFNSYVPKGASVDLAAHKILSGRNIAADEFEFQLKDASGKVLQTKKNDASGNVSFDSITYSKAGTYTYTISEVQGSEVGVKYDSTEHKVTVEVVDKDGQLVATALYDNGSTAAPEFCNEYQVKSTKVALGAQKSLDGRALKDREFRFKLTPVDGAPGQEQTAHNNADGKVSFNDIEFTEPGTYTYRISEVAGSENGMRYDEAVRTVTVEIVNKDNAGQLVASVDYDTGDGTAPVFQNFYTASGSTQVSVLKTVNGSAPDESAQFDFALSAVTKGAPMPEEGGEQTTTTGAAVATFGKISFGPEDAGKTYTYKVSETSELGLGWTRANDALIEISVGSMDESTGGVLPVSVKYVGQASDAQDAAVMNNLYKAVTGNVSFSLHKTVNDEVPAAGKTFTFSAKSGDADAPAIADATTDADGNASFSASLAEKDMGKEYTYTVHEENQLPGYTNAADQTVKIKVSDALDADGNVWAKVEYPDGASVLAFDNRYEAEGKATVQVRKTVNGENTDKSFDFQLLKDGEVVGTATTSGSDAAAFPEQHYTLADAGKTYTYRIHESTPAATGWTNAADQTVTVEVGDDQGDGTLGASTVTYEAADADAAAMDNTYVEASGEFQLVLLKTVNGKAPLDSEKFEFSATSEDEGAPAIENVTTVADGSAKFAAVKLGDENEGKTYTYTIHEVTPAGERWTNAPDVTATVKVSKRDAENQLHATVVYGGDETATAAKFDNAYTAAPASAALNVKKLINGTEDPDEQHAFSFQLLDENGEEVGSTTVTGTGEASFDELSFDKPGTYNYTVHEEELAGGWFNAPDVPVQIVIGYDANGRDLVVEGIKYSRATADGSAAQFDNKYTATGSATIAVAKTVNGGTAAKDGEEFEFELLDKDGQKVDGVENVKVKAGKTAEFKALGYTLADADKTFDYTVHEIAPAAAGWTAANDVNVQVKVTDNGDGTLNCAVSYLGQDKADQAAAAFDNTYAAAPATAAPTVQKTVKTNDGRVWEMKAGQFSFQLKDSAGTVLQTKAVDVNGHVAFDKLSFDKAGRYTYTISEAPVAATKAPNVKRDPTVYSVTYVVDEKNDGTLNARDLEVKSVTVKSSKAVNKPIQGDGADQNLPFVNSETPRTPETPKTPKSPKTPKAPKSGKTPKTGDVTSNTFAVVAGTAGLVLVATTLHRRRREG